MALPAFSAADFLALAQRLLPTGPIWPRESTAVLTRVLSGLMPTYERHSARSTNLIVDAFPATALELLPEWEATLGLPDPCSGPDPTVATRQAHVVARLAFSGGQSIPYFEGFAQSLGYPITITEFAPFCADRNAGDQPLCDPGAAFLWEVTVPSGAPAEAVAVLRCEFTRLAPAHTIVFVTED